jgi:glucan phosphoethanolaminetransferase (alkaline phosphatase superfamily)
MFDTIAGLPLHPLVVHATEVLVPAAAIVLLLAAVWPKFRRWAGVLPLVLTVIALVLVPVSSQSGESLESRVGGNDLIETHSNLAEGLLPWVFAMVAVAAVLLWWNWNEKKTAAPRAPKWVAIVLAVSAVLATAGTTVQAIRVGHSGATAVWSEDMASTPASSDEG